MNRQQMCIIGALILLASISGGQAAELAHRWSFNGDLRDSEGGPDAAIVDVGGNDAILSDTEVTLTGGDRGASDFVDLPDGALSSLGSAVTLELWATPHSVQVWSRIFSIGASTSEHFCMSWTMGTNPNSDHVEFFGPNDHVRVDNTNAPYALDVEYHIVCVFEAGLMTWYTAPADSAQLGPAKGSFEVVDVSTMNDVNCWLGRSHYPDGTANASYNEVRLWAGALSALEREELHDLGPDGLKTSVAREPFPADGATDVPRAVDLSWIAGQYAATHDVYLGTSWDDVNGANRSSPGDVLISQGQPAAVCDPGLLEFGQTYYWRVDEVNAAPDNTVFEGVIWSFTVEPMAYVIQDVVATSNTTSEVESGPEKTVDGSGLNADGQHSTLNTDMWVGSPPAGESAYIEYEFDRVYKLYKLHVWNYNLTFELLFGFGFKDVTIEYSQDGLTWIVLKDAQFAQATARSDCAAGTIVDMEGVAAQYVRLTANAAYGMMGQYGLSEVRFLYTQVQAREPEPADGAAEVPVGTLLDWRTGREAAVHEIHLGTAPGELTLVDTVVDSSYDPALNLDTTYYWQVVEVNEAAAPSAWAGDLWSFSTEAYLRVDDFESYIDDKGGRIYEAWVDGYGVPANGSQVGYLEAPFAERTTVHGGRQAMPLFYDNAGGASVSEAELTLAGGQDWTQAGATTLTVHFYGNRDNSAAQMYAKINGTKVSGGGSTTMAVRKQWDIDLAATGISLQNVTSVTIGVEGSGSGVVYVDDLRVYREAPESAAPVDPGTDDLVAHYGFESSFADVTGNGYDGTSPWSLTYVTGPGGNGQAAVFNGAGDYVDLPIGSLLTTLTDSTFACLVDFSNEGGAWQRIFDFGSGSSSAYMLLCPREGTTGPMRFAITTSGGGGESIIKSPKTLPTGWRHVAVVISAATMTVELYLDGDLVGSGPTATLPSDLGETTQNWLGRSQYEADDYFNGALDEFRIYKRALSGAEIRYLAGDR